MPVNGNPQDLNPGQRAAARSRPSQPSLTGPQPGWPGHHGTAIARRPSKPGGPTSRSCGTTATASTRSAPAPTTACPCGRAWSTSPAKNRRALSAARAEQRRGVRGRSRSVRWRDCEGRERYEFFPSSWTPGPCEWSLAGWSTLPGRHDRGCGFARGGLAGIAGSPRVVSGLACRVGLAGAAGSREALLAGVAGLGLLTLPGVPAGLWWRAVVRRLTRVPGLAWLGAWFS
jgi:hypothetical protein